MGQQISRLDLQTFARAASLFRLKREVLAPGSIETLASDIVRRLSRQVAADTARASSDISPDRVAEFCDLLVEDDPSEALRFISRRRAEGSSLQDVYHGYIASAASALGKRWDDDLLTFAKVTIATGHLYALMRALRNEENAAGLARDARKQALFATVPGEDHGIGITIAADLFRQAGWEIDLQIGLEHDALMEHIDKTEPHIIALSLSTEGRLEELVRLVIAMRIAAPHAIVGVAPGTRLDRQHLMSLVDVDLWFSDVASSIRDLERLVKLPQ